MKENKKKRFSIKTSSRKKNNVKPLERFAPRKKEDQRDWKEKLVKHRAQIATRVLVFVVVLVLAALFFYIRSSKVRFVILIRNIRHMRF